MLRHPLPDVCGGAAGTIQNLSREAASRALLLEKSPSSASGGPDALSGLADLLVSSDVPSQVSAAGALLNVLGPDLEGEARAMLHELLSDALALGAVSSCLA